MKKETILSTTGIMKLSSNASYGKLSINAPRTPKNNPDQFSKTNPKNPAMTRNEIVPAIDFFLL